MPTANQMWKAYQLGGGTLDFKPWMNREKKKNFLTLEGTQSIPTNQTLTEGISSAIEEVKKAGGLQGEKDQKYILGVPKNVFIASSILIGTAVVGFIIYKKSQS